MFYGVLTEVDYYNILYNNDISLNEMYENIITNEGANLDYLKTYRAASKQFKEDSKEFKKLLRVKNYSEAKEVLNKMKQDIKEAKEEVKKIDSSTAETIIGFFINDAISICMYFIGGLIAGEVQVSIANIMAGEVVQCVNIPGTYKLNAIVATIITTIKQLIAIKNAKNESDKNIFRKSILDSFDKIDASIDKLYKALDKAEKKNK